MIKLNHATLVNNKSVVPFLIQDSNVYCFDKYKKTVILPITSFKTKKTKKNPIVPIAIAQPIQQPQLAKPEPPVEETIIIKPKIIHAKTAGGLIRIIGSADYHNIIIKERTQEDIEQNIYKYDANGLIKTLGTANYKYTVIKPLEKKYEGIGIVQAIGAANTNVKKEEEYTPPPVIDNNRFVRPTLDDEYI